MNLKQRQIIPALLVVLTLCLPTVLQATGLQVLSPADKSYVEHEQLNIVVSLPAGGPVTLRITGDNTNINKAVKASDKQRITCLGISLIKGINTLDIAVYEHDRKIMHKQLSLYLRSSLSKPHQQPPVGYQRYYFHLPQLEAACSTCHRMEATLYDLTPAKPTDSPCYPCHKNKGSGKHKHKPVSSGTCFSCHEQQRDKRKYTTCKPDQTICFTCHSAQAKQWKQLKVHHGPTAVGNCTTCHDPHGSDWPSFVHLHPTDLCLNCHHDKKSGLHVIAGFFAKGHPVRGTMNPLKKDRPFSCAGCHNPHAGDTQNLLNRERASLENYCQTCHKL